MRKPDEKKDRSLDQLDPSTIDVEAYWKKISAGGEMKSAIKFLLDWSEKHDVPGYLSVKISPTEGQMRKKLKKLREAMEAWTNAG